MTFLNMPEEGHLWEEMWRMGPGFLNLEKATFTTVESRLTVVFFLIAEVGIASENPSNCSFL